MSELGRSDGVQYQGGCSASLRVTVNNAEKTGEEAWGAAHPAGWTCLSGLLGGPVGWGQRGRRGPPRREGQQCPGEALECGRALEGDAHKGIFYVSP